MNSRFKFLSSVDPKPAQPNSIKPQFNKLTLATTKCVQVESKQETIANTDGGPTVAAAATATKRTTITTTTTTIAEKIVIAEQANSEAIVPTCGQKPKILLYESTLSSTVKHDDDSQSDILTDDDTDSVGSSVDTDFIHKELVARSNQATKIEPRKEVEAVGNQLQNLSISIGTTADKQSTNKDGLHNLSQKFNQMELLRKTDDFKVNEKNASIQKKVKTEKEFLDCSVLTLSSLGTADTVENDTQSALPDSEMNDVIVLSSDDEDDDNNTSDQPPAKHNSNDPNDGGAYNVSPNLSKSIDNLPSSSVMQKINNFFDNVPTLEADTSLNTTSLSYKKNDNSLKESIYVSETETEDNESEKSIFVCQNESTYFDRPSRLTEKAEQPKENNNSTDDGNENDPDLTDNDIKIDIPVPKSSSDQPRQLIRSQSGIKLTATHSTPLETASTNSECVKRSSSNVSAVIKSAGSSIKVNSMNGGQVNISAKININIQISKMDASSSDDSSENVSENNDPSIETPAIESEQIEDQQNVVTPNKSTNQDRSENLNNSPTKPDVGSPSSPEKVQLVAEITTKTPTTASKIKRFEFVAPKSITKSSKKQLYETPKKQQIASNKENTPENLPSGFEIDKNIPVDPKDQLLLHQVYGEAWKTPEVLRCYTSIKGKPKAYDYDPSRSLQNIARSRMSKGFNVFKRNIDIDADLDSTRLEELSMIENVEVREMSPLKKEDEPAKTPLKASKKTPQKTPQSKKKLPLNKNVDIAKESQSVIAKKTNKIESPLVLKRSKRNAAEKVRQRLKQLCDTDSEDDNGKGDFSGSSDGDGDWVKTASNESSCDTDDEEFVPPSNGSLRNKVISSTAKKRNGKTSSDQLVYFDLSAEEVVEVNEDACTNVSEEDLAEITRKFLESDLNGSNEAKPTTNRRRKLFTQNYEEIEDVEFPKQNVAKSSDNASNKTENDEVHLKVPIPMFNLLTHKLFDSKGFGSQTPKLTPRSKLGMKVDDFKTPINKPPNDRALTEARKQKVEETNRPDLFCTPTRTYSFLQSLDVCTPMTLCHPDAVIYRKSFNTNKEELAGILYKLYNNKVFDGKLDAPITWNKKLTTTAGRCLCNQRLATGRMSRLELSDKVLTSADRLRCTLIHEMCHAATWTFNGDKGHGAKWKAWASKANKIFPELPSIKVCHNYDIEYKYTYQCDLCQSKSHSHSKSKKVENIRCSYCHSSISIFLNKKQKDGQIVPTPVRQASGFAKFVKEKYKDFKEPGVKHADVMKMISGAFSSLSVEEKKNY